MDQLDIFSLMYPKYQIKKPNNQVTIKGLGEDTNEITQDVELELDYEKKVIAYDNFKLAIDVVDNYSIQLGEENKPIIVLNENTKCLLLPMRAY